MMSLSLSINRESMKMKMQTVEVDEQALQLPPLLRWKTV